MNQHQLREFIEDHNKVEKIVNYSGMSVRFKTRTEDLPEDLLMDIIEEHRCPSVIFTETSSPRVYEVRDSEPQNI